VARAVYVCAEVFGRSETDACRLSPRFTSRRVKLKKPFVLASFLLASTCLLAQNNSIPTATGLPYPVNESEAGCSIRGFAHQTWAEGLQFGHGLASVPRNAVRPSNLKWELPILATTGVLIAKVDRPAANRIQSTSLEQTASRWSNVGLGLEIGSAALAYGWGCSTHHTYLREAGFTALAAMAAAGTVDLGLKLAFDRQFPYTPNSTGKFWGGGRSFPSGHSATSFAFAAVVAHRYPHNQWVKWGAYALATGVSLSRYPAKKHFPSDILIGATLGYVTGTYLSGH
jgi:membrane-associated phospholipid phosphatase